MAIPLTIAVPPLKRGNDRRVAVHLVADVSTQEQREAIKLLPVFVKIGRLKVRVVLGAIGKETLEEAFTYLKKRLDPEEGEFEAAPCFRQMTWIPEEPVEDFFRGYLKGAKRVGITAKTSCVFTVSQSPIKVQQKPKNWVRVKEETLSFEEALQFVTTLGKTLSEKGIA